MSFIYIKNKPAWHTFDEGRVIYEPDSTYFAETYIKDHLGNIRVAYGNDGVKDGIRQVNAYYPFGMNIQELSANSTSIVHRNEYLYNGKMMQDELGLDWLEYGARMYDAKIGRWHVIDLLTEEHCEVTPFAYVMNNPISFIDLFGLDTTYYSNLPPVEIVAKRDKHAEIMNNPFVKAYHKGQNDFASHPLGNFVLWGWSYVVPIPYIEKGINCFLKKSSNIAGNAIRATSFHGAGKNLISIYKIGSKEIWINSGHGFLKVHSTGSFSTTKLTQEQIETAIIKDIESGINLISKDGNNATRRMVKIDGVKVGYKVIQINDKISVSTYYPNPIN